uniref:Phage capsid scaffolding protein (GPO) serine peptidase n=1 Tax=Arsenophonus endosymbiont of Trialeurodes vaporariorum TaxID=235567 RepID=A0A3B0MFZ3_9GAMM
MTQKTKPVRLCFEGATTDGRQVQREWLTEIANNYDSALFGARINMEHWNYAWMPLFGDVESVYTEEIQDGPLAGKLALYGVLSPTDELIEMNQRRQKVYTSVEINPSFADTGSAYLIGLAVTDNPASLGNGMLQFSTQYGVTALSTRKQATHNVFTAAEETAIEFTEADIPVDTHTPLNRPSLLTRVKGLFSREHQHGAFDDIHKAVEYCASQLTETESQVTTLTQRLTEMETLTQAHDRLKREFDALKTLLATQEYQPQRPVTRGNGMSSAEHLTDC